MKRALISCIATAAVVSAAVVVTSLQGAYQIPDPIFRQFDPVKTPEQSPVFRPEAIDKYVRPEPYGTCYPGGTPTSITTQASQHGPLELIQVPGRLWLLTEFPQTIRMVPTDGRPHPKG